MSARRFTLLAVDDDPGDRELLRYAFQPLAGLVSIRFAFDGAQAIDYLSGAGEYHDRAAYPEPDVLLLDLKLPRRSGFEVLQWARERERYKAAPIFIMTSSPEDKDSERCYALGATAVLVKTPDVDELERTVRSLSDFAAALLARG